MKQEQNEFVTMLRYITVRCTMMVFAFGVCLSLASCDEEDEDPGEDTGYVDGGNQDGGKERPAGSSGLRDRRARRMAGGQPHPAVCLGGGKGGGRGCRLHPASSRQRRAG